MKRVNEFDVRPRTEEHREVLLELLDASAALWNEITYYRRQAFFDGDSVWTAQNPSDRYKEILGSVTAQQVPRKNSSAWRSFFTLNEQWHDDERDERPSPPGYWGNEDDGRELRTYIRNDSYTLEWGDRSRLEIPVGKQLKAKYDISGRLRLEISGDPKWDGKQGRLEIEYDEVTDSFRAYQPVTVPDSRQDSPLAAEAAALDLGANNLVACTTTTGKQFLYAGRSLFDRFRKTTETIAEYQSKLPEERSTSRRIERLYRQRTRRRDHAQNALVRDLVERLHSEGVCRVYVGDLSGVLTDHWSCVVNSKTHNFWAFGHFRDRLRSVCEEFSIEVIERSEAGTTATCPNCGERENTHRRGDVYRCGACGFEGHADLKASRVFLDRETNTAVGPMARPVCLQWDNHEWRPDESTRIDSSDDARRRRITTASAVRRKNSNEGHTNRTTHDRVGNIATAE